MSVSMLVVALGLFDVEESAYSLRAHLVNCAPYAPHSDGLATGEVVARHDL